MVLLLFTVVMVIVVVMVGVPVQWYVLRKVGIGFRVTFFRRNFPARITTL